MAIIRGTENNDNIENPFPPSNDIVYGGGGNDRFDFGYGKDTVYGGSGDDTISSFYGADDGATAYGESGDDVITVISLDDNKLSGGEGFDSIWGGIGVDTILGGNDDDTLFGLNDNDRLYGEEGNDIIVGGYGSDVLSGGNGDDTLSGLRYNGIDYSNSDTSNDKDMIFGGNGSDTFVLGLSGAKSFHDDNEASDLTYIEDFKSGEDKIQLSGYSFLYTLTGVGSNTNIYLDKGENNENELIAIVKGNSGLSLDSSDFTFV